VPPVAEIVFVEVFASVAQLFDDDLVGEAIIEHAVDVAADGEGQAGDFAIAPGPGLAGLELAEEVVFNCVREQSFHRWWD
jgi:hypothetical protein